MAKEYKEGNKYYLPVIVDEILYEGDYPVKLTFNDGGGGNSGCITDEPGLLLTAEEVASNVRYREAIEKKTTLDELKAKHEKLSADYDELERQNVNLMVEIDNLKEQLKSARDSAEQYKDAMKRYAKENDEQYMALCRNRKVIDVLADKIMNLETTLANEREKNNG